MDAKFKPVTVSTAVPELGELPVSAYEITAVSYVNAMYPVPIKL
jgi:hypothetical protein